MEKKDKPYESLRIQISKVSEMADISSRFSEAVSVDHLLSLILKQTLDLMNTKICIIWLKDKSGDLIPRMSFGLKTELIKSIKIRSDSSLIEGIMVKDRPTAIYGLITDEETDFDRIIREEDLRSLLATPLAVADDRFGVLMICARDGRQFEDVDLKIFDALARQSALAIANISLYDRMDKKAKEKIREMSTLLSLSKSLGSTVELGLLLDIMLEKACVLTRARFCTLRLMDKSRRRLVLKSSVGLDERGLKTLPEFEEDIHRRLVNADTVYMMLDINTYFKDKVPSYLKDNNIQSLLMIPLFSKRRRAGLITVYISEARSFSKDEVELFEMIAGISSMALENAQMLDKVRDDYLNMIKTLAKVIDANDHYTRGHCEKVMRYSLGICKAMNLEPRQASAIKTASMLHDIGKIGIDLSIMRKEGALTESDWVKVRMHPEIGAGIVSHAGFSNEIAPIIRYHHKRFGGGGYPESDRSCKRIPLGARIIAVTDAFDAMTSSRPYRKTMSKGEAILELKRCAGSQFDPEIVKAFLSHLHVGDV